jgi:hypothetical protein
MGRNNRQVWCIIAGFGLLLTACSAPVPLPGRSPSRAASAPTAVAALASAVPTLAAGWTTYTDPVLGYSLSFPQDVDFTSGMSKAGVYTARLQFNVPGVDGYQGMVLRVEPNPEARGIEQVVEDLYRRSLMGDPPADWAAQLGAVTVAGLSGRQMGQGGDFSLVVPYQDRVYILAPVHDLTATALDPQALALFYQILGTLRMAP